MSGEQQDDDSHVRPEGQPGRHTLLRRENQIEKRNCQDTNQDVMDCTTCTLFECTSRPNAHLQHEDPTGPSSRRTSNKFAYSLQEIEVGALNKYTQVCEEGHRTKECQDIELHKESSYLKCRIVTSFPSNVMALMSATISKQAADPNALIDTNQTHSKCWVNHSKGLEVSRQRYFC